MISRLDLNLAKRPFTNDVLLWTGLGLLVAGVLALSTWNGVQLLATGAQVQVLTRESQALREEGREASRREEGLLRTIEAARSELLASRATFANTIIKAHAFSWTRLFNELEKVMPLGARVMNIRPRLDDGIWIRISGVARNVDSFWELQENLQRWPVFGNVYPDAVQPTASRAGIMSGELIFTLEMEYFPDARLLLGLPEDEPGLVESVSGAPVQAAGPGPRSREQADSAATEVVTPAAPATGSVAVRGAAPGAERASGRPRSGRRALNGRAQGVGVQRKTKLAEGAPGLEKPDIGSVQLPEHFAGMALPQVTFAGRNAEGKPIDEDGNVISIEDMINRLDGIKPGKFVGAGAMANPGEGKDDKSGTDGKSPPTGGSRENKE